MFIPNPSGLTATADSSSQINLQWQPSNGIVDGYQIERYDPDALISFVIIASVNTTSYQDVNLNPATEYIYRLCAVLGEDNSEYIEAYAKTLPPLPQVPTHLTPNQAVEIAKAFCQSIGHPVGDNGAAQFPVPDEDPNDAHHWQLRWQVEFETEDERTVVEVIDPTGVIASYNTTVFPKLSDPPDAPADTALSQVDAIQIATHILQVTNQVEELTSMPQSLEVQLHDPPLSQDHFWIIRWQRQLQGISYRRDGVMVRLQAETGALSSLRLNYPTPPPASIVIIVDQSQADNIAQAQIMNAGLQGLTKGDSKAEILQPNTFWQNGHTQFGSSEQPSRVAWVTRFWKGDPADNFYYEVWVDAQTGDVLGGDACFGWNGAKPKHNSARTQSCSVPR